MILASSFILFENLPWGKKITLIKTWKKFLDLNFAPLEVQLLGIVFPCWDLVWYQKPENFSLEQDIKFEKSLGGKFKLGRLS